MDALIIALYVSGSFRMGDIPYWEDLKRIIVLATEHSDMALWLGLGSWVLHVSLIVSSILFLTGARSAVYLALVQSPFRLLILPSIPLSLFWSSELSHSVPWLFFLLGMITEFVKVSSLVWLLKNYK
ncbi:hypothetical protein IAE35_20720 [Pseudomonas sp. S75]|uniref:hypothetical protein n=1 Tax=unclassified Pseudomonas TaxID=196821 RepID=UPI001907B889|nr:MULTISPECIES: hypothetical protein [unclassified Pseudomonas]MBJ9976248.1 hypothetical protein [Pseudomonas sp. S30]MBK0155769.1 hypothetical protein [Pseudomonas sp. S75]